MSEQKENGELSHGVDFECLRAAEVAQRLGISSRVVFRLLRTGKLPGFKLGRTWLIRKVELEKYLLNLAAAARAAQMRRRNQCA